MADYEHYIELMSEWCKKRAVEIRAYSLMPNHVHLISVPSSQESLRLGRRGASALQPDD